MANIYYYKNESGILGALSFDDLVHLAKTRHLTPDTEISVDSQATWTVAGQIPGLFHMAGRADEVSEWRAKRRSTKPTPTPSTPPTELLARTPTAPEAAVGNPTTINSSPPPNEAPSPSQPVAPPLPQPSLADDSQFNWEQTGNLSREIKAATYAAALEWQTRHKGKEPEPQIVERETPIRNGILSLTGKLRKATLAVILFPLTVITLLWSFTGIKVSIPNWVFHLFDHFLSAEVVIACFRWAATLAVPNLIAWGVHTWSITEAQRYPVRGNTQPVVWSLPLWGECSSPGEYYFLLIDIMVVAAVATYFSIRWLEAQADD